ncbi:MAG TPA: pantoate--beta-alanine ligase [Syntrophales bacterium]|nr:pantoate--beta-alanine ligase [Syntrophales bacterium]
MQIIHAVKEMKSFADAARGAGKRIAFVPTMGYFHDGHLDLMREARRRADWVVVSIYVNPTQFGPREDLDTYPRDFERDRRLAEGVGVDVIFFPDNSEMYPPGYQTYVDVEGVTRNLCGRSRPGHFRGVTTVCAKLFNIVKPQVTVFGTKDFQQLAAIKRMVTDLNMDLDVVGRPTTREADGLAMSSRNVHLCAAERPSALSLSRSLQMAERRFQEGERDAATVIRDIRTFIEGHPFVSVDYIQICDSQTLEDVPDISEGAVLAMAVRVGKTRLIDNHVFGEALNLSKGH